MAVTLDLLFREVLRPGRRRFAELAVARDRVKQLIIDGRAQVVVELDGQFLDLGPQGRLVIGQLEECQPVLLDGLNVGEQRHRIFADTVEALVGLAPLQPSQLFFKGGARLVDAGDDAGETRPRFGGRQAGSGVDELAAVLRDAERRRKLRNATFVHPALGVAHLVKRKPADQARADRQRDRYAKAEVELRRDAKADLEQAFQSVNHSPASRSVSIV